MMNDELIKKIMDIDGYTSLNEGFLLYSLAKKLKDSAIAVEVGSWKGRSTAWLALGLKEAGTHGQVVAIDHGIGDSATGLQETAAAFLHNIKRLEITEFVKPIFEKSQQAILAWSGPIQLLFIDAAHDYESVRTDFGWERYLADGGWIVFHDVLNPSEGPTRIFLEKVIKSNRFNCFGTVDSVVFARKMFNPHPNIVRKYLLMGLLRAWIILTGFHKKLPKRGIRKKISRILMKDILRSLFAKVANHRIAGFSEVRNKSELLA